MPHSHSPQSPQKPYLLDGPLMETIERRRCVLMRMAQDLETCGVPATERDTVRLLLALGYYHLDVALLAGEARMVAFQEIVAREMGRS
jgi:hypothetical protein